jgi:hypothetical protein
MIQTSRGGTSMKTFGSRASRSQRGWIALAIAAAWFAPVASSQPVAESAAAAPADELVEPAARAAVKRMVETLTGAQKMSYEYEASYDALQDDGEILEFGGRGAATIRRPDRLRGESWSREGRHLRWAWDGTEVSVLDESQNVFASTPRSGDVDSLIDFLRDDVGMRLPTADLFTSDLGPMLVENVVAARSIGKEKLDGVEVEHVALRLRTGVDVQLWIQTGEQALPTRLVMNFATADGRPQFRAEFREWDLDPRARDSLFELEAPKGARVVPFVLSPARAARQPVQEDVQ